MAALVVPGLVLAARRARWVLPALALACLALLLVLEVHFLPRVGWFSHGRYAMPAAVGIVLGAAVVTRLDEWLAARGWLGRYLALCAVGTVPVHLYALAKVTRRFQYMHVVPPLLVATAGLALLLWVTTRHGMRRGTTVGRSSLPYSSDVAH